MNNDFNDLRSTGLQKNSVPVSVPILLESYKWNPIPIGKLKASNKDSLIEMIIELNKKHNNFIRDIQILIDIAE